MRADRVSECAIIANANVVHKNVLRADRVSECAIIFERVSKGYT